MSPYLFVLLFAIDRISKLIITGGVINAGYIDVRASVIIISTSLIILLKYYLRVPNKKRWVEMIVVGGISNLLDILFYGGIIDNISLFGYYLNLSDIMISIGIVLLLMEYIKWKK